MKRFIALKFTDLLCNSKQCECEKVERNESNVHLASGLAQSYRSKPETFQNLC